MERYQPSTARVLYTFKLDEDGEPPDIEVYYMCPNCHGKHRRGADYYLSRNMPFEALGYALAPNRVLLQDLHVQQKWIKFIEVEFGGVKYPAKEVLRYPLEGGVLVETEKPVEGLKPLVFEGRGIPEKPEYFYVMREKGLTVSGVKGSKAASFKHYAETGRDFYEGAANTLVVNEKDEAVTVALQANVELGKEQLAPPSKWTSVPASAFADEIAAMEKRAAEFVVPLYARLESESKDSGRSYRGGGDACKGARRKGVGKRCRRVERCRQAPGPQRQDPRAAPCRGGGKKRRQPRPAHRTQAPQGGGGSPWPHACTL